MKAYHDIYEGIFLSRPNRFIANVRLGSEEIMVHVKNTGRCRELLVPGATVYLEKSANPARKTTYDLVAVRKGQRLINMDSQIPNAAAEEWIRNGGLFSDVTLVKREVTYGNSRFDMYVEHGQGRRAFVEVKGVTLEIDNVASFPDAPTERGIKHIRELAECLQDGYEAYLLFVIQMKDVDFFEPAYKIHPDFAQALQEARDQGVQILACDCQVTRESITIADPVEVRL